MSRRPAFCYTCLVLCSLAAVACADFDAAPVSATPVRLHFPDHAELVLERGHGFVREASRFVSTDRETNLHRKIDLELPEYGDGVLHLRGMNGVEIGVREVGAFGQATREANAIAYARTGGSSFWTATPEGFEEWIYLRGDVTSRQTARLVWEISGAPIAQDGPSIVVLDPRGVPALRVTAPVAFDRIGRNVPVEMLARDNRIELFVESNGEEVLVDPNWVVGTAMGASRYLHTATALPNGDVLVVGGAGGMGATPGVELWSAATSTWSMKALPGGAGRSAHTATLMPDGRVFVVGGMNGGGTSLASTAYFDVGANSWVPGPNLLSERHSHAMTVLSDGRLLVTGGTMQAGVLDSVELLDAGAWVAVAPMSTRRVGHTATLLHDGRVLVAGGDGGQAIYTYEIYDPVTSAWSPPKNLLMPHFDHTAVRIDNGKVLLAGGHTVGAGTLFSWAELYDPATDTWSALDNLQTGRYWHTATWLPKGAVFVAGGYSNTNTTEFIKPNFPPPQDMWIAGPMLAIGRERHTTTLLNDFRLLVAGGQNGNTKLSSVELLQTQLETGLACSNGIECTTGSCADGVCCDRACDGQCNACSVAEGATQDGVCTILNGTCSSSTKCHIGICDPKTGDCLDIPAPDNTPCAGDVNGMPTPGVCLAATCYVEAMETGAGGAGGSMSSGSGGFGGAGGMGGMGGDAGTAVSTANSSGSGAGTNAPDDDGTSDFHGCGCRCTMGTSTTGTEMWATLLPLFVARRRRSSSSRYFIKGASKS